MKKRILVFLIPVLLITSVVLPNSASIANALLGDPGHECPPDCEPHTCPCENQCSACACPCPASHNADENYGADSMYMHAPKVEFPTLPELFDYYYKQGIKKDEFSIISNTSEGTPSDIQATIVGNTAWVAWLGKINGTNNVFITVSRDNLKNFEEPVILSTQGGGNATNLQLGVADSGRFVDLVWQGNVNGTNTIFFSNSMNFGQDFKTYPLNQPGDGNARDPILEVRGENVILVWKQQQTIGNQTGDVIFSHGSRW